MTRYPAILEPLHLKRLTLRNRAFMAIGPQTLAGNPDGACRLFRIGDAVARRNVHAAIYDALRLCSAL